MSTSSSSGGGAGGVAGDSDKYEAAAAAAASPSSSSSRSRLRRRRSSNGSVWPEPFMEALALKVAVDSSATVGRLSAAHALFNIFLVSSNWGAISRSELLWQNLTRRVWNVTHPSRASWHDEYIYHHRTCSNFRLGRYVYNTLHFALGDDNNDNNDDDSFFCRCLALSDHHLAAGFSDGAVRLLHLETRLHFSTLYPQPRDRLGRYSSAVSGLILSNTDLVFASLDGDIHKAVINGMTPLRRAYLGDVVNDGVLVDFTGCNRWWVGLFAGVPGRAFHIWNSQTEELVFVGGTLTDPEAVMGWHLLTESTDFIGRVRVTNHQTAVACTSSRLLVFDLENQGVVLGEEEYQRGIVVSSFDCNNEFALIIDGRGTASMRNVANLAEVCRLRGAPPPRGEALGCVNDGYGLVCSGGVVKVWEMENGQFLRSFGERIGACNALAADERCVAACSSDGTIHVWDFGARS